MSRLTGRPRRQLRLFGRRRDAGGVAVIIGILTATGVLLGMAALAVDVGQLYAEREELQSGADGVANAVALDCAARRTAECTSNPTDAKLQYGNGNAKDGLNDVREVCGDTSVGGGASLLPACSGVYPDNLTNCIGEIPPNTKGYVQVHTRTLRDDPSRYILPPTFAQTLAGGFDDTTVKACSRVAWGTPMTGVALTFCEDEYNAITNNGTKLAPAPPALPDPPLDYEQKFNLLTPGGGGPGGGTGGPCDDGPSGWDLPGDFGWLDPINDRCEALIDAVYDPMPGVRAPSGCKAAFEYIVPNHIPVAIPIFDGSGGTGSGGSYVLKGIAAIVFTGYNIPAVGTEASLLTGRECTGSDKCLFGYFTQGVTSLSEWNGQFSSTPSFGAVAIKTVG